MIPGIHPHPAAGHTRASEIAPVTAPSHPGNSPVHVPVLVLDPCEAWVAVEYEYEYGYVYVDVDVDGYVYVYVYVYVFPLLYVSITGLPLSPRCSGGGGSRVCSVRSHRPAHWP